MSIYVSPYTPSLCYHCTTIAFRRAIETYNMSITIIDAIQSPDSMPSFLGRNIIDDFALFAARRTERVVLLNAGEAEDFVNIPTGL